MHKSPGKVLKAKVDDLQLHEAARDAGHGRVPSPAQQLALLRAEHKTKRHGGLMNAVCGVQFRS